MYDLARNLDYFIFYSKIYFYLKVYFQKKKIVKFQEKKYFYDYKKKVKSSKQFLEIFLKFSLKKT